MDVYGPTKKIIEAEAVNHRDSTTLRYLESSITGLDLLGAQRYHSTYNDHRSLPILLQYHLTLNLVIESLDKSNTLKDTLGHFLESVNAVVSSNGIYLANWKKPAPQSSTLYSKVDLEIARLCAGDFIGVYVVKVRGKGRVPHHSHTFLDEHHFLPERIHGIHQIGNKAARCEESDIVYIKHGTVHAFRNDEDEDRSFVFVCGSRRTGPWDFVQDIKTYPSFDFPEESRLKPHISDIGGRALGSQIKLESGGPRKGYSKKRLSPNWIKLRHNFIEIDDGYKPGNVTDRQYFVSEGKGSIEVNGKRAEIGPGDTFVTKSGLRTEILNESKLVLHEFVLG